MTTPDTVELLSAATEYATQGLPVLPLHTVRGGRCTCGKADCDSPGKHPRIRNGLNGASADVSAVASWWQRWPDANVGIRTGESSGLVVLDIDTPKGGSGALDDLERRHGRIAKTARVLTGSGGQHVYLRHPGGQVLNSEQKLGAGLDVRGDGGYVVAPPSMHASGRPYKWTTPLTTLAYAPEWLLDATSRNGATATAPERIAEGERNATLASIAGSLRRRGASEGEILDALRATNAHRCKPPLADTELETIARSIARYEPEAGRSSQPPAYEESVTPAPASGVLGDVLTARELCALPDPPEGDLLLGPLLVRAQRLLIGAHTGEGKTTIAFQLVRAVALGESFLDWPAPTPGRVLIVDAEQGLRTIKRRLHEAGLADSEQVDYLRAPDGLTLDRNAEQVAALELILESGYDVVLADPLYKIHGGDSNAEREAVDLMRLLDRWREQYGFALILCVHLRKPPPLGARFTLHEFFGSGAYPRGAEVAIGLQRLRAGYSRLHFLKDRDGDLPIGESWGLLFDRDHGYRRDPQDEKPATAERVRELRDSDPTITQKQAAASLGVTDRTVRKYWNPGADTAEQTSFLDDASAES